MNLKSLYTAVYGLNTKIYKLYQCSYPTEISQMIYTANEFTGFYMVGTLVYYSIQFTYENKLIRYFVFQSFLHSANTDILSGIAFADSKDLLTV